MKNTFYITKAPAYSAFLVELWSLHWFISPLIAAYSGVKDLMWREYYINNHECPADCINEIFCRVFKTAYQILSSKPSRPHFNQSVACSDSHSHTWINFTEEELIIYDLNFLNFLTVEIHVAHALLLSHLKYVQHVVIFSWLMLIQKKMLINNNTV